MEIPLIHWTEDEWSLHREQHTCATADFHGSPCPDFFDWSRDCHPYGEVKPLVLPVNYHKIYCVMKPKRESCLSIVLSAHSVTVNFRGKQLRSPHLCQMIVVGDGHRDLVIDLPRHSLFEIVHMCTSSCFVSWGSTVFGFPSTVQVYVIPNNFDQWSACPDFAWTL